MLTRYDLISQALVAKSYLSALLEDSGGKGALLPSVAPPTALDCWLEVRKKVSLSGFPAHSYTSVPLGSSGAKKIPLGFLSAGSVLSKPFNKNGQEEEIFILQMNKSDSVFKRKL